MEVEITEKEFKFKIQGSNLLCPRIPGAYSMVIENGDTQTLYTVTVVHESKIIVNESKV